ncbi:MAG: hypothetical protein ABR498_03870 [Candidatus Dormibacteria bacterium]
MSFQSVAQGWHDFFLTAGAAAATLVGLLFVGLSLHLRTVLARPEVRALARVTLANFTSVLFVALFMLIPQDARNAGLELQITGAVSLAILIAPLRSAIRSETHTLRAAVLTFRLGIAVLCYAATIAAGVLFSNGAIDGPFGAVVAVVMAHFSFSLRNTWDLLVSVGEAALGSR